MLNTSTLKIPQLKTVTKKPTQQIQKSTIKLDSTVTNESSNYRKQEKHCLTTSSLVSILRKSKCRGR